MEFEKVFVAWRKAVRFIWKLPANTHCSLVKLICRDTSIESQIHTRFIKFLYSIVSSDYKVLGMCDKLAIDGGQSAAGKSFNFIRHKYNLASDFLKTERSVISRIIISHFL